MNQLWKSSALDHVTLICISLIAYNNKGKIKSKAIDACGRNLKITNYYPSHMGANTSSRIKEIKQNLKYIYCQWFGMDLTSVFKKQKQNLDVFLGVLAVICVWNKELDSARSSKLLSQFSRNYKSVPAFHSWETIGIFTCVIFKSSFCPFCINFYTAVTRYSIPHVSHEIQIYIHDALQEFSSSSSSPHTQLTFYISWINVNGFLISFILPVYYISSLSTFSLTSKNQKQHAMLKGWGVIKDAI